MRNRYFLLLASCFLLSATVVAQNPAIKWQKYIEPLTANIGTRIAVITYDAKPASSGGFIVAGSDEVANIYVNPTLIFNKTVDGGVAGLYRFDANGNMAWGKLASSFNRSSYTAVLEAGDGTFVAAGHYTSTTAPQTAEFFISKYSVLGDVLWNKTMGGANHDIAYGIARLPVSGYLVAGITTSNDRDVSGNHNAATSDAWLVKLDENGNRTWQKCFGGTGSDSAFAVIPTADSGFIVAGSSTVTGGDVPGNNGNADGWIFKINQSGNIVWSKNYGGAQHDAFKSIAAAADGTFVLTGYSRSSGNNTQVWVMHIDADGNLLQERFFGGTLNDYGVNVSRTINGQFLISAHTESGDGDISEVVGMRDAWYVLYDVATAALVWNKNIGSIYNDYGTAAFQMPDNEFIAVGFGGPEMFPVFGNESHLHASKLGNSNAIKGTLFLDNNLNGSRDAGEAAFTDATVKIEKAGFTGTAVPNGNGQFKLDVEQGTYTSTPVLNNPYYIAVPANRNSVFTTYFNIDSTGYAIQPVNSSLKDLVIDILPIVPVRPGFQTTYQLKYKNAGTETINNVVITLQKDGRLTSLNHSPIPSTENGNILTWQLGTLAPLAENAMYIRFTAAPPPTLNNGDTVKLTAWIDPVTGDQTPANDTSLLKQVTRGSYDPNDKTEANAGVITLDQVSGGDYLNYLIRFQNTGTDTAFNVYVRDTLDARLDWNTLEMISASHSYNLQIAGGDKLTWTFADIKLADSNINEPASHGYIAYRIKPKPVVAVGDTIHNTASIYFDFNLPVETNNAFTLVMLPSAALPVNLSSFTAKLNGSVVNVNWKTATESKVKHFEVQRSGNGVQYNTIGIVKAKNIANGSSYSFNDNNPLNGYNYYRLKMVDVDKSAELSSIVIINNSNGTSIVTAVYPNPTTGKVLLRLQGQLNDNVRVQVLDHFGREMISKVYGRQSGNQLQVPLELGKLSKGNYILRIYVGEKVYLHKLLIQ